MITLTGCGSSFLVNTPVITGASINSAGTSLTITFNRAVVAGTGAPTLTADSNSVTLTYASGTGTSTWVYTITNGNSGSNPVLSGATCLLSASVGVWIASGSVNAAISSQSVTNGSRTVNAGVFTRASTQTLSAVSDSVLQAGDISIWETAWIYMQSNPGVGTFMNATSKWKGSDNTRSSHLYWEQSSGQAAIGISSSGTNGTTNTKRASTFGALSTGTWYFCMWYYDPVTDIEGISVNGGVFDSFSPFTGGLFVESNPYVIGGRLDVSTECWDGKITCVYRGKNVVGGFSTTPATTIRDALWNGGVPLRPSVLSSSQKTAFGCTNGWLDTTLTTDVIGSNTLTNNNSVTLTTVTF